MKKDVIVVVIGVIFITAMFCGCQSTEVVNNYENIFESDVVNLINYTIEPRRNREGNIVEVGVSGRIENILDRSINVIIIAEFYDKNDEYIGESSIKIFYLKSKNNPGSSTSFPPPYLVYDGINVNKIDHVRLRAEEFP